MRKNHFVITSLAWLAFGFCAAVETGLAQSQAIDGLIEGFVKQADGSAAIAGAKVKAANRNTGYTREAVTDAGGRYALPLLPPGGYTITVEKDGFPTIMRQNVEVGAGQSLTIEFDLSSTRISDVVEISAQAPLVETGRTVVSNTYEERVVRSLPTVGRSILDFFVLQPGVNARPISTGGSGTGTPTTTYGGLGLRQMNVDGVSNNLQGGARNLVISQEAMQEFQTVVNFSAEFGRVGGGLQNAFTRSGGNVWHGSGYLFTRQKFLSAKPFLLAPTAPKPEFSRYNFGGTGSGPVIRDRAFFFVSYERWVQDLPGVSTISPANAAALGIPATSIGAINQTFRAHTLTARFDAQMNENNRLFARYNYYFDRESPLGSGQQSLETLARFDEDPHSATAQLVTTVGPRLINEARFLFATRGISNGVLRPDAPNINISGVAGFNGNSNGARVTREQGFQLIDNLSWTIGRHQLKFGFDILPVKFRERTTNINGSFVFGGLAAVAGVRPAVAPLDQFLFTERGAIDPSTNRPFSYSRFTQSIGKEFFEARVVNHGYFAQDDLRVNDRLKINLGLRYEYFSRPEGNLNPDLPATGVIPQDRNNLAPRIGLAWDVLGNARTVVRGGYGIYFNTTVAQTFNTFLRGNGREVINLNVTPATAGAPAFTRNRVAPPSGIAVVSDVRAFDSEFDDVTVHNFYVTGEQQLLNSLALALTYQGTRGRELPVAFNTNLRQNGTLPDGRRLWATTNRPDPRYGNIFVSRSVGEQNYNGLIATLTKRFTRGFSFQAAYHLSKTGGAAFADDFTGFGIFTSPSDPLAIEQDRGPGDFDMRHRFTLTGIVEPRFKGLSGAAAALLNDWQLSSRVILSSGYAFNATTGQDGNGDAIFNDRPAGIGYNAYSLPGYATLDLRLSRSLRFGENRRLEFIGESFNLTNRLNPTNVNRIYGPNAAPNATFRQVTQAETARQFQLAVRFGF
jgi:Carboxypeptidase regulatory-like domain/TonB dependent receptor